MEIIFGIIFLLIAGAIYFLFAYWLPILLVILAVAIISIIIYSIYFNALKKRLARVAKARLIRREPIIRREKEIIGYEENAYYYPYRRYDIFRYIDVIVGYRTTFSVEYKDGERDTISCREGSYAYHQLVKIPDRMEPIKYKSKLDPTKEIPANGNKAPGKVEIEYADGTKKVFEFDDEPKAISKPQIKKETVGTKSPLAVVRKNLTVDDAVFRHYGIIFKCNLFSYYDALQLNFELSNTKQLASKIDKNDAITIKANVYDAKGNLLCIEEEFVDYSQLRRGYAADYLYFISDSIMGAHSMKVYALDPADEYEDYDAPAPDYDAVHTYCGVTFEEGGKAFHYRTRNPELKVGDQVYVPVGYKNQKQVGTIVSIEDFVGHDAPFPLEKTKFIIGKVEENN